MIRDAHQLTARDAVEAVLMWLDGFDTLEIATELNTREPVIYNQIPAWRRDIGKALAA